MLPRHSHSGSSVDQHPRFLFHAIPKFSRAGYPRQRAAFPLAFAFVLWAVGFFSMAAAPPNDGASQARPQGTLAIETSPASAPWTLDGPESTHIEDEGSTTLLNMPTGLYSILWRPLTGYQSPAPTSETLTLAEDSTSTFTGVYSIIAAPSPTQSPEPSPSETETPLPSATEPPSTPTLTPTLTPTDIPATPTLTPIPTTPSPSATPSPSLTPSLSPTPSPVPAIVYLTNLQGHPYQPNSTFTVDVAVRGNTIQRVITYGFRVRYNGNSASLTAINDVALGGMPPSMGPVTGSGANTSRAAGSLGNSENQAFNLTLCRLTFQVGAAFESPYSIELIENAPNYVLVGGNYKEIPSIFDNSGFTPLPGAPTPSPTLSPTPVPTTPTLTLTPSPSEIPTTPTLSPTPSDTPSTATLTPTMTITPTEIVTPTTGTAVIYLTNLQGSPYEPNSQFTLDLAVRNNPAGPVIAYGLRIQYDGNSASLVAIEDVELGGSPPDMGPAAGSGTETSRAIASLGNSSSPLWNPTLCRLTFQVSSCLTSPYSITVLDDFPNVALIGANYQGIQHEYDNSAANPLPGAPEHTCTPTPSITPTETGTTQTLTPTPAPSASSTEEPSTPTLTPTASPTAEAVISMSLYAGNTTVPGSSFDVLVRVSENETGLRPLSCAFLIHYPGDSVSTLTIQRRQMGLSAKGPIVGTYPNYYRKVAALGDMNSTRMTPECFLLRFTVVTTPTLPFALTLTDDPGGTPLLAPDLSTAIPHKFANGGVLMLGYFPTPTPTLSPTVSPEPTTATPEPTTATPTTVPPTASFTPVATETLTLTPTPSETWPQPSCTPVMGPYVISGEPPKEVRDPEVEVSFTLNCSSNGAGCWMGCEGAFTVTWDTSYLESLDGISPPHTFYAASYYSGSRQGFRFKVLALGETIVWLTDFYNPSNTWGALLTITGGTALPTPTTTDTLTPTASPTDIVTTTPIPTETSPVPTTVEPTTVVPTTVPPTTIPPTTVPPTATEPPTPTDSPEPSCTPGIASFAIQGEPPKEVSEPEVNASFTLLCQYDGSKCWVGCAGSFVLSWDESYLANLDGYSPGYTFNTSTYEGTTNLIYRFRVLALGTTIVQLTDLSNASNSWGAQITINGGTASPTPTITDTITPTISPTETATTTPIPTTAPPPLTITPTTIPPTASLTPSPSFTESPTPSDTPTPIETTPPPSCTPHYETFAVQAEPPKEVRDPEVTVHFALNCRSMGQPCVAGCQGSWTLTWDESLLASLDGYSSGQNVGAAPWNSSLDFRFRVLALGQTLVQLADGSTTGVLLTITGGTASPTPSPSDTLTPTVSPTETATTTPIPTTAPPPLTITPTTIPPTASLTPSPSFTESSTPSDTPTPIETTPPPSCTPHYETFAVQAEPPKEVRDPEVTVHFALNCRSMGQPCVAGCQGSWTLTWDESLLASLDGYSSGQNVGATAWTSSLDFRFHVLALGQTLVQLADGATTGVLLTITGGTPSPTPSPSDTLTPTVSPTETVTTTPIPTTAPPPTPSKTATATRTTAPPTQEPTTAPPPTASPASTATPSATPTPPPTTHAPTPTPTLAPSPTPEGMGPVTLIFLNPGSLTPSLAYDENKDEILDISDILLELK